MHRVELVKENHSRPFQRSNQANVAVVDFEWKTVFRSEIIDRIKKVDLVVVIFAFCQVKVAIVKRETEKLEIFQLTRIQSAQTSEAWIVSDTTVNLAVEKAAGNNRRLIQQQMNYASQTIFFFDFLDTSRTRKKNFDVVSHKIRILEKIFSKEFF